MTERLRTLLLRTRGRALPDGAVERIDRDGRIRIERPARAERPVSLRS